MDPTTLRPALDAIAHELSGLLWDRQLNDRFGGIVRSNKALLQAAQHGNPFLNGVRRWWATASALVLRRHVDGGTPNSLRVVLEILVANADASRRPFFESDLAQVTAISERFRPYLNALIHGEPQSAALTYDDLSTAIDTLRDVAQRAYATVTQVSRRLDPVAQFEWTDIFTYPWIVNSDEPMAYILGSPGVPYDAVPMTRADAAVQARLQGMIATNADGSVAFTLSNVGQQPAHDLRAFVPFAGTVIDHEQLDQGASITCNVDSSVSKSVVGQAVIEFEDQHGDVYRQYADVNFPSARLRKLDRIPYRVSARIVAPAPAPR